MKVIIDSYNTKEEVLSILEEFRERAKGKYITITEALQKPTYDEVEWYTKEFGDDLSKVTENRAALETHIGVERGIKYEDVVEVWQKYLGELQSAKDIVKKNLFMRLMIYMKYRVEGKGFYYIETSSFDKYDLTVIELLSESGVNILLNASKQGINVEYLVRREELILEGSKRGYVGMQDLPKREVRAGYLQINDDAMQEVLKGSEKYFDYLVRGNSRESIIGWHVNRVEMSGVENEEMYGNEIHKFLERARSESIPTQVILGHFQKPDYDEAQENLTLERMLANCVKLKEHRESIQEVIESKEPNKIVLVYIQRVLKQLCIDEKKVGILVLWGAEWTEKEKEYIHILEKLPIDIVHFNPSKKENEVIKDKKRVFNLGVKSGKFENVSELPKKNEMVQMRTVANRAEEEVQNELSGTMGLYRNKQFNSMSSITIAPTYDEMLMYWGEDAQVRPNFETTANEIKIPNMFVKVNGVLNGDKKGYERTLGGLVTENTIFIQDYPYVTPNVELREYAKQVYFNGEIDFERLRKSAYYTYKLYSDVVKDLIDSKVALMLKLDWCVEEGRKKSIALDVVSVAYNLRPDILQMMQGQEYAKEVPKVMLYARDAREITIEDSILMIFLKLCGFDVAVWCPTGYQILEGVVKSGLYTTMDLGNYQFDMPKLSKFGVETQKKKKKLFGLF